MYTMSQVQFRACTKNCIWRMKVKKKILPEVIAMDYTVFVKEVYKLTSIDLALYKERQMKRRIDSLIKKEGFDGYDSFLAGLKKDKNLYERFISYLTINVSEFFRNIEQWKILNNEIFPYILEKLSKRPVIWSAACSTGEEPYSLVMVLSRFVPLKNIHIIATDIDKQVLAKAKLGIYNEKSISGIPKEFVEKYMIKNDNYTYSVCDEVKKCVEFRQHNLLRDPYIMNCDLIVCRNVLIYFTEDAKDTIFANFNKSLKEGGVLFIGSTEQIIKPKSLGFETWKTFFYRKA